MSLLKLKTKKLNTSARGLKERIEKHLEEQVNKPLPYTPKPSHKPSALGHKCLRRIYYSFFATPRDEPISAFLARIFDTGHRYEDMVVGWLKEMGEHIPYRNESGEIPKDFRGKENPQFPITIPDWRIRKGYIDNIAIVNGKLLIHEIKSKNADKFEAMTEPDREHLSQVACYFKAFNDHLAAGDYAHIPELEGFERVDEVLIIYVNKNNSDLKIFSLEPHTLVDEILDLDDRISEVNEYIDKKKLPPKVTGNCKYCDFKEKCRKNWNAVSGEWEG